MFVLAHLLVGVLIGVLLYLWRRERWLILAAAVGSILPDLIDKPLGYLILEGVNFGRIYFHSLIFLLAFVIAGLLIWWKYRSFIGIAVALGVLSHQVLDLMWAEYWNWLWPFFGPFRGRVIENFFLDGLIRELSNPSEWLIGLAILLVLVSLPRIGALVGKPEEDRSREVVRSNGGEAVRSGSKDYLQQGLHGKEAEDHPRVRDHPRLFRAFAGILVALLAFAGIYALYCGFAAIPCPVTGFSDPADNFLMGLILLGAALVLGWIDLRKDAGNG
jgi:hypothetical protein